MKIAVSWSSQHPCERLEICKSDAIAGRPIVKPGVSLRKGVLCVDDFENRGLAVFVTERGETKTVGGEFSGSSEARQFVKCGFRFGIEGAHLGEQLPLGKGEFALGLVAPEFG